MSTPQNLTEFLRSLPIPWLVSNPVGYAEAGALGQVLDSHVERFKDGIKARFPTYAPADALPHIATDRSLIRGPAETEVHFRERLRRAWDDAWPWAGTPLGILIQLYHQGYTAAAQMVLVQQNGKYWHLNGTLNEASPTGSLVSGDLGANPNQPANGEEWWTLDLQDAFCSRYALLFTQPLPAGWNNVVSPPQSWTAPSLSEVNTIRSILNTWGPAAATCTGIFVCTAPPSAGKFLGWPPRALGAGGEILGGTVVHFPMVDPVVAPQVFSQASLGWLASYPDEIAGESIGAEMMPFLSGVLE